MDETSVPRATNTQESNALSDIPLSDTELLMDCWKPILQTLMQQFLEFDNEGYDIKSVLYDCAKLQNALHQLQTGIFIWTGIYRIPQRS